MIIYDHTVEVTDEINCLRVNLESIEGWNTHGVKLMLKGNQISVAINTKSRYKSENKIKG